MTPSSGIPSIRTRRSGSVISQTQEQMRSLIQGVGLTDGTPNCNDGRHDVYDEETGWEWFFFVQRGLKGLWKG